MITELLQKSITEEDIGADVDTTSVPLGNERATLFKKYPIPPVLTLKVPAFKSNLHAMDATSIKVLATPNQRVVVHIEALDKNLKWFSAACTFKW